jgi:hypothetical protein
MDLLELHVRTGFDMQLLRKVLDRKVIPGLTFQTATHREGRSRQFAEDAGFAIVCAANLTNAGLPPRYIRLFLGTIAELTVENGITTRPVLAAVLEHRYAAVAYFADGAWVRITIQDINFDTGWKPTRQHPSAPRGYIPAVKVALDLQEVLYQIYPKRT